MPQPTRSRPQEPLWRTIGDTLRARIDAGRYAAQFPGEWELAEEFGVSRGTVRAALRPLRDEGLVMSRRGRRPQLAQTEASSRYGAIYALHDVIVDAGFDATSTVLAQEITVDRDAASRLECAPDEELFRLERVRFADGAPLAHDVIFAPALIARALMEVDFTATAFYAELRTRCGIEIDSGTERLEAVGAGPRLSDLLECARTAPLLAIERVARAGGRLVEYRRTEFRGDRFVALRPFGSGGTAAYTPAPR